jgi:glyoxylase-like metal-dependent hydrolase (beta-lactamase superfamily II)
MTAWVCNACGTQYAPADEPPDGCPICDDPRQYVPHGEGQTWTAWNDLVSAHQADVRDEHGLLGIGCTPGFAIGQRALLVRSTAGNVLWDCIPYLDDELVARIENEGGIAAIAISHPHFHTAMIEWAHTFGCPVYVHEDDARWVMRPDASVRLWSGESHELGGGLTLVRCGGHFDGAQVLHWAERRALLVGDVVMVVPDRSYVSFMYSFPNLIPLPASKVERIGAALAPFAFDVIYGGWWGRVIEAGGSAVVQRSVDRYVRAVAEPALST